MFKLLSILVFFLRELIFDSKEEYNFKSAHFNPRKFSILVLIFVLLMVNAYFIDKLYTLASVLVQTREAIVVEEQNESIEATETAKRLAACGKK